MILMEAKKRTLFNVWTCSISTIAYDVIYIYIDIYFNTYIRWRKWTWIIFFVFLLCPVSEEKFVAIFQNFCWPLIIKNENSHLAKKKCSKWEIWSNISTGNSYFSILNHWSRLQVVQRRAVTKCTRAKTDFYALKNSFVILFILFYFVLNNVGNEQK